MLQLSVRFLVSFPFLALLTLNPAGPVSAQDFTVRLTEELRIGDDESADLPYLFASITTIAVGEDGSFYVVEHNQKEIRHFDADGRHIQTVGAAGKAPGEFEDPRILYVDSEGALVVIDRLAQRVTRYPANGGDLETTPLMADRLYQPGGGAVLSDGRLVLTAGTGYQDNPEDELGMISVFDGSMDSPEATFAPASDLFDMDDSFEQMWVRFSPLNIAVSGAHVVHAVRNIYDGELLRFEESGDAWSVTSIQGYPVPDPAYQVLDMTMEEARETGQRRGHLRGMHGPEGSMTVDFAVFSVGLFARPDGSLLHFIGTGTTGDPVLKAELFNPEGAYQGVGVVEGFEDPESTESSAWVLPQALKGDLLYCVVYENTAFTVRIFRIHIEAP